MLLAGPLCLWDRVTGAQHLEGRCRCREVTRRALEGQDSGLGLVFRGSCNKGPQAGWLKATDLFSQSSGGRKSKIKVSAGLVLGGPEGGAISSFLQTSGSSWQTLACSCLTPPLPPSCPGFPMCGSLPSHRDVGHWMQGPAFCSVASLLLITSAKMIAK